MKELKTVSHFCGNVMEYNLAWHVCISQTLHLRWCCGRLCGVFLAHVHMESYNDESNVLKYQVYSANTHSHFDTIASRRENGQTSHLLLVSQLQGKRTFALTILKNKTRKRRPDGNFSAVRVMQKRRPHSWKRDFIVLAESQSGSYSDEMKWTFACLLRPFFNPLCFFPSLNPNTRDGQCRDRCPDLSIFAMSINICNSKKEYGTAKGRYYLSTFEAIPLTIIMMIWFAWRDDDEETGNVWVRKWAGMRHDRCSHNVWVDWIIYSHRPPLCFILSGGEMDYSNNWWEETTTFDQVLFVLKLFPLFGSPLKREKER